MTGGLHVYLGSGDMVAMPATLATLARCGATGALVLVESVDGRRQPVERVVSVCAALRASKVEPMLYSFPAIDGDLYASRVHLGKCHVATGAPTQLDAEPHDGTRWSAQTVAPWLASDRSLSITTTRAEAPRVGKHDRDVWAQLESQTSTQTLVRALTTFTRFAPLARIVLVTGVFGSDTDPRTTDEVRVDLARCTAQARRTGRHGVWSARSLASRPDLCAVLHEWSAATWA